MKSKLELVYDGKAVLAEGPSWDMVNKKLLWVDILQHRIHLFDPMTKQNETIDTGQKTGAVVPHTKQTVIAAMENGFYRVNTADQTMTPIFDPEPNVPGNRFNDGKCDPAGRFWAGTMDMEEKNPTGALYSLETSGTVVKKASGITVSNGIAWSPDHRTMYHIDSPTRTVYAWDFELESGQIESRRIVTVIPEGEGFPDGMTVDAEGTLWIALWDGWKVIRLDPDGGRMDEIAVPAARVTSCCFAGDQLDELFITTARIGIPESALENQPHAGGIFRIKPGVKGVPTYRYKG